MFLLIMLKYDTKPPILQKKTIHSSKCYLPEPFDSSRNYNLRNMHDASGKNMKRILATIFLYIHTELPNVDLPQAASYMSVFMFRIHCAEEQLPANPLYLKPLFNQQFNQHVAFVTLYFDDALLYGSTATALLLEFFCQFSEIVKRQWNAGNYRYPGTLSSFGFATDTNDAIGRGNLFFCHLSAYTLL